MLAGVGCGLFTGLEEAAAMRGEVERFEPSLAGEARDVRLSGWKRAVESVVASAG